MASLTFDFPQSCRTVLLAVLAGALCSSVTVPEAVAELPDAPSVSLSARQGIPRDTRPVLRYWSPDAKRALTFSLAARATDAALTCRNLTAGGGERWLPVHSCAGTAVWIMGGQASQSLVAWYLWRAGHRRLARVVSWAGAAPNVAGVAYTLAHGKSTRVPRVGDTFSTPIAGQPCVTVVTGTGLQTRCK